MTFGVVRVCSAVLVEVADLGANIAVLVLIFMIGFAMTSEFNCFPVYINELYPKWVRMVSLGFIKAFGTTILLLESYIVNACLYSGFRIMILFAVLAGQSIMCS